MALGPGEQRRATTGRERPRRSGTGATGSRRPAGRRPAARRRRRPSPSTGTPTTRARAAANRSRAAEYPGYSTATTSPGPHEHPRHEVDRALGARRDHDLVGRTRAPRATRRHAARSPPGGPGHRPGRRSRGSPRTASSIASAHRPPPGGHREQPGVRDAEPEVELGRGDPRRRRSAGAGDHGRDDRGTAASNPAPRTSRHPRVPPRTPPRRARRRRRPRSRGRPRGPAPGRGSTAAVRRVAGARPRSRRAAGA